MLQYIEFGGDAMKTIEELEIFAKDNYVPIARRDVVAFLSKLIKDNNYKSILEIEPQEVRETQNTQTIIRRATILSVFFIAFHSFQNIFVANLFYHNSITKSSNFSFFLDFINDFFTK